jgi:sporulation protein YlmC with PRC-barrel domain
MCLKKPDWNNFNFPIELDKSDIEKSPKLENNLPVSRKYEEEMNKSYKLLNYWEEPVLATVGIGITSYLDRPIKIPTKKVDEKDIDTKLRSFNEIIGYNINAIDGKLGHVEDLIIDDVDWQIVYVVVNTKNWLPWSKKVLIAIQWMEEISYVNKEVKINLHTNTIEKAPEYDSIKTVSESYEKELHGFFENLVKMQ